MQSATSSRRSRSTVSVSIPRAWVLMAGAAVIAAQLVAVGLVVQRQVAQASERQAVQQTQPAAVLAQRQP